jgi:Transposase domain (DUF772)
MNGFERYTKKTRRQVFLEEMEQVVPWREVCALIEPHYPKPGNGRPPVGVERMLRIYFLQQWFNLSDPAVEESLYDSPVINPPFLRYQTSAVRNLLIQRVPRGSGLGIPGNWFGRHALGFNPAADIDLSLGLATEMPGGGAAGSSQIPLDDRELLISARDHKPMDRILADGPANLALEFLHS